MTRGGIVLKGLLYAFDPPDRTIMDDRILDEARSRIDKARSGGDVASSRIA